MEVDADRTWVDTLSLSLVPRNAFKRHCPLLDTSENITGTVTVQAPTSKSVSRSRRQTQTCNSYYHGRVAGLPACLLARAMCSASWGTTFAAPELSVSVVLCRPGPWAILLCTLRNRKSRKVKPAFAAEIAAA